MSDETRASIVSPHFYAEAVRDEYWRIHRGRASLVSRRLEQGYSHLTIDPRREIYLSASSDPDKVEFPEGTPTDLARQLASRVSRQQRHLVDEVVAATRDVTTLRILSQARYVARNARHAQTVSTILGVENRGWSIVTIPDHLSEDLAITGFEPRVAPIDYPALPMIWRRGSAAVLLHEAIGHRSLHYPTTEDWPEWIRIVDDPGTLGLGHMAIDDTGSSTKTTDLTAGETPSTLRRENFRQVPSRRMTNLVVTQQDAPFRLPEHHIEILAAHGGDYDPLTDRVTVTVSGRVIEAERRRSIVKFEIREKSETISRSLAGARGEPIRYPGFFCSDEGYRMATGSWAPEIVTSAFETCRNDT